MEELTENSVPHLYGEIVQVPNVKKNIILYKIK